MKRLALIIIVQCVILIAFGLSLFWNIHQAQERSECIQGAYIIGFRDGGEYLKACLIRARIERELIEEARANDEREKL